MLKNSIKSHLRTYSIYAKRKTTINHAFASAIAPADPFDEARISEALTHLGQDPAGVLVCVFCGSPARTWDHLVGLVKDGRLNGYGHQLGNLVPCCKTCNSRKGNKDWRRFVEESNEITGDRGALAELLASYLERYARPVDLSRLEAEAPASYSAYEALKDEIHALMRRADDIAGELRLGVISPTD